VACRLVSRSSCSNASFELGRVELLALAAAEDPLLQPRNLQAQLGISAFSSRFSA